MFNVHCNKVNHDQVGQGDNDQYYDACLSGERHDDASRCTLCWLFDHCDYSHIFVLKKSFRAQPEMPMSEKFDLVMEYFGKMAGR